MNNLKKMWFYFKDYKFFIFIAFIASAVVSATDGATAYIVKDILDDIFIAKNRSALVLMPFILITLFSTRCIARFLQDYLILRSSQKAIQRIRDDLYTKMIELPISYYEYNNTGTMMSKIINDVSNLQNSISSGMRIFRSVLTVFFLTAIVLQQNLKLGLTIFLVTPILILIINKSGKIIKRNSHKIQEYIGKTGNNLNESFSGIKVVKSFGNEEVEQKKFLQIITMELNYKLKQALVTSISSPLIETFAGFAVALVIFYGGSQVINGTTTVGTFFSFLTAFGLMFEPFKKINNYNSVIQTAIASAERIFEVLETKNTILDNNGELSCDARDKDIILKDVSFRYSPSTPLILNNISLTIKSGTTVAIVGSSGSGKSTMVSLIPRFYELDSGSISIGDKNIVDFDVHSLRRNISTVAQEPFLFNKSIEYNITYGSEEIDLEKMHKVAKDSYCMEFIEKLQNGFDTLVGERGSMLSGGQRQRITIARALYMNPPILILDEATSALDSESEEIVQKALDNLISNRTSIVIAHRLSTILNADMIVVIDKGHIESIGKHSELLNQSEIYSHLYSLQFKGV
ncbi:MAG: ABC transporter ATP-binding protein [Denitrovibrio sp.]|nr:MAG: ABC transporter ATP-binding protein [Denitrovibrio sp.]